MPQRFGLYEDLSVQENLDLYADLHGVPQAERRERYPRLMEMTDLGPLHRAPGRQALGRHEAEAGPGLHAGALARAAAARRADGRRRSAVAARAVGDRAAAGRRGAAHGDRQHRLPGRGGAVRPGLRAARGPAAGAGRAAGASRQGARPVLRRAAAARATPARALQARLLDAPATIVDAVPQGGEVRFDPPARGRRRSAGRRCSTAPARARARAPGGRLHGAAARASSSSRRAAPSRDGRRRAASRATPTKP